MISNPLLWLLITPLICAAVVYIVGRAHAPYDLNKPNISSWCCVGSIALTTIPFFFTAISFFKNGVVTLQISSILLQFDGISLLLSGVLLLLSLAVTLFSVQYMSKEHHEENFYSLLMILITSIIGLSTATDIFNLYVWFELMAVSTYTLVSFYRTRTEPLEAGLKYLIQSASGSVFIIIGIAILFGITGSVSISEIRAMIHASSPILIGAAAFFFIGYGIKCAFVPLHFWLPDAHSQAPAGISAMLSGIVIETGLIALLRSLSPFSKTGLPIGTIFLIFGALNMIIGNLNALRQREIKRMFAYSSISHMGYIALGVGFMLSYPQSATNNIGIFAHIFNHAMMKGLAFLTAGALVYLMKISEGSHDPLYVEDLDGASQKYPLLAFLLSIAVLALGGLPFFSGFLSKWQIMASGALALNNTANFLLLFMGLNSVLSLGYYAPLVNRLYKNRPSVIANATTTTKRIAPEMLISLCILGLAVILLGFFPSLTANLASMAGKTLYSMFY